MKRIISLFLVIGLIFNVSFALASDGLKTIYIFVKDEAGNIQSVPISSSITLDRTPPVIDINLNPNNAQTQTKTVRANITDTNLDTVHYIQVPSGIACNGLLNFENSYTSGNNIVLSSEDDNNTKICFRARDKANNYSYQSSNLIENIDTTAPTITVTHKDGDDEVISSTDPTTVRKIGATIFDPSTGSDNFGTPTLSISNTLSPGTYSDNESCASADFTEYTTERIFNDPIADNGKQVCFKGEDDAGNVSYDLVTVVMNAIPTFTSVSKNTSHINSTNQSAVSFTVNGILDNDNDDVEIFYSWDQTTWISLDTVNDTNIEQDYGPFNLDTSSRPEGNNTLYVKLNDGNYDSDIKNVTIFKDSILPVININNISNTNPEQVKYMSGTITDNNSVNGFIKVVDELENCNTQDYTIAYTSGTNITLDNESYNGMKICFKAVDEYDNVSYLASDVISGIDTTPPVTPTSVTINGGDLFTNDTTISIDISHPDESDVYEWCVTEDNDFNSCLWTTVKPTSYTLIE